MFLLKMRLHGKEVGEVELESGRQYTFGRGSSCDVVLEPEPGISRSHFRLYEENGRWTVQVISKFGEVSFGGHSASAITLEPGLGFELGGYKFEFNDNLDQAAYEEVDSIAVGQNRSLNRSAPSVRNSLIPYISPAPEFDGNDEATRVGVSISGLPYLRMVEGNGDEQTLKLEGSSWVAGREDGCEILLNDRKASRRQFELSSSKQGFFIRDLGSSNGTTLNGVELGADELRPLRSGDLLMVGKLKMTFEIRDPDFEKRVMVIPPELISHTSALQQNLQSSYEMINYPVLQGPGGAVRFEPHQQSSLPTKWQGLIDFSDPDQRKKKLRLIAVAAIVLLLFIGLFSGGGGAPKKPTADPNSPFARLTPQKQQVVRETYVLGRNLFLQSKPDLALDQFNKLHEIIPEGFEESHTMSDKCKEAIRTRDEVKALERAQVELAEHRRIVDQTLAKCGPIARSTLSMGELDGCLAPAMDLDPGNPQISEMKSWVQQRLAVDEDAKSKQRDYAARVGRGRAEFEEAAHLEAKGQIFEAMMAYQKHIDSPYPDPANLKLKSQKNLLSIQKKISAKIDEEISASQQAFASQNYKEAINHILKAKALDPKNDRAAELNAKIRHEVNAKCKDLYEEAIISEGLGDPEKGVALWKRIIEMDSEDGDYYHKAKSKLKKYGKF